MGCLSPQRAGGENCRIGRRGNNDVNTVPRDTDHISEPLPNVFDPGSFSGRIRDSDSHGHGSIPCPGAIFDN